METIIGLIVLVFVLVWAYRIEKYTSELNQTAKRIEKQIELLSTSKEKK